MVEGNRAGCRTLPDRKREDPYRPGLRATSPLQNAVCRNSNDEAGHSASFSEQRIYKFYIEIKNLQIFKSNKFLKVPKFGHTIITYIKRIILLQRK